MELGRVALKERDITDLLTLYGVSDTAEIDTVLTLAKRASAPGWWRAFGDVGLTYPHANRGLVVASPTIGLETRRARPPAT
jgi:hypothetical protein